ncbi:excinuclease ABC subunit C [Harryflintia acetispora]|uniref:UvrABC system protein C n=2 Tax=Harryflintia acetispora TaxID=1849041 RepID=A0A9X8ULV5_9FIRM|nr:excinuclease ABC subunit C [Harryflintia acetispora]
MCTLSESLSDGVFSYPKKENGMVDMEHIALLRKKANELPLQPGVYLMRDKDGVIIYIGKAKRLKNRVTSYFRALDSHTPKVLAMVENVKDFDYILTDSEFEALVLESSLIKQHSPKYNILLKDDKGYFYIHITDGPWRRIDWVKSKPPKDGQVIGPYTSSYVVSQTVEQANKIFMLPTCKRQFPQDFRKGRPCLNFHIKQCMGVCTGKIPLEQYNESVDGALRFIKGNSQGLCEQLEEEMAKAAENLEFEKAARLRDRIAAIRRISGQQKVLYAGVDNCDIMAMAIGSDRVGVSVMNYRHERLCDKQDFLLSTDSDPAAVRAQFLMGYYRDNFDLPRQVYLDGECEDGDLIARYLTERAGHKVELVIPQRGQKNQLVELCRSNAAQYLSHRMKASGKEVALLDEVAKLLGLRQSPQYIEAYDISNIGASTIVGGMVAFEGAKPLRSAYRKFTIKSVAGAPDDYASMKEMLTRRFERLREAGEKGGEQGFGRRPDLLLIDGGAGHVAAAKEVLDAMGLVIPCFGMVKDDKHRTRAIASDGGEIQISAHKSVFSFITSVQDEVHRYTISFSRKKHRTTSLQLELMNAPGIGEARARALYKHFRTLDKIRAATGEELEAAPGMNKRAANALYAFLHPQTEE